MAIGALTRSPRSFKACNGDHITATKSEKNKSWRFEMEFLLKNRRCSCVVEEFNTEQGS